MKEVIFINNTYQKAVFFALSLFFLFTFSGNAQDAEAEATPATEEVVPGGDAVKGKELFNGQCAACHRRYKKATGPALHGVTERRDQEWIYKWIKNSQQMIASGDAQAVAIYEEYNKTAMPAFPQLSNQDIDNILAYVEQPKPEVASVPGADGGPAGAPGTGDGTGISLNILLGILIVIFAMLAITLFLVSRMLQRFAVANGYELPETPERTPIWKAFVQNQFLVLVSVVVLLLGSAYFVYGGLMSVGVDQGYMPIQPIHYSHKIHAGLNQIDCKYCHSSARVSKHSGIPSLNVCMNCHKAIQEYNGEVTDEYSKEFYDNEIKKLYTAVGWDVGTQSYTGETKPVKWIRIHNLPDFAYFNHSQHVSVAGIECQKCHGPVEEMEIMYQYSSLTMGWCINCHRETQVNVAGNGYYDKIHEELSKKYGVEKLTAAQMGGLECGKCHY